MISTPSDSDVFHFNYDVFISYKSEQDSWANRIARSLEDMGLRVWRDKDGGIRIGEEWRDEINAGIRDSQNMLVLWSRLIHENSKSVVHDEIRKMKEFYEKDPRRRFFTVNLDGISLHELLSPYHATYSFRKLYEKYGDNGADNADVVEWYKALLELLRGLGIQNVVEVRFAAIAMTREQAE
ncbi:MAG: toll/interleukin-1 receptor domain-containing protein [Anaerolineae bacterium]|nr:toll/interleukin-1 receptor domain-containing protein [Anaerolineae bacterium]